MIFHFRLSTTCRRRPCGAMPLIILRHYGTGFLSRKISNFNGRFVYLLSQNRFVLERIVRCVATLSLVDLQFFVAYVNLRERTTVALRYSRLEKKLCLGNCNEKWKEERKKNNSVLVNSGYHWVSHYVYALINKSRERYYVYREA